MIHDAKDELAARGFFVEDQLQDDYGTIGYLLSFLDDEYALVAKEYAYDNMASFIAPVVVYAPDGVDFIFYCHEEDSYTVFDGEYVREHAEKSRGQSKQRECAWYELDRSAGAELDDVIRNEDRPATISGDNQTLGDFA